MYPSSKRKGCRYTTERDWDQTTIARLLVGKENESIDLAERKNLYVYFASSQHDGRTERVSA